MARGHRLNTSIVLAAVHGLSGLFRAVSAVEPFTLSSPSLIGHLASVDVKQHERTKTGILSATGLHALKIPDCSGKVLALQNVKQTLVYVLLNVSYSCFITYYIRQTVILQCMYIETSVT